jgi:DNA-binding NtrC family response regulator
MVLRIGIVEDEIGDMIHVLRNLLALDPSRYNFELVPVLLSDPQIDTAEALAEQVREFGQEPLARKGITRAWPTIECKGMLCPADEQHRAQILRHLAERNVNAIISDSWIGTDTSFQSQFSGAALKLAGVMLLDAAEQQEQWRERCWMMTKYQRDVFDNLLELGGWQPEKFEPWRRYLRKPLITSAAPGACDSQLERLVDECLARLSLLQPSALPAQILSEGRFNSLIGRSQPMLKVYGMIQKVAPRDVPVVILGESGVGKELVAREIHGHSPRANGAFEPVDCGVLDPHVAESVLFGHVKGSFTGAVNNQVGHFERAKGGTLFLDEIGNLDLATQAKFLRALQEGQIRRLGGSNLISFDARVLAATNKDLEQEVLERRFRGDLFQRLSVIVIQVPPLRERGDDIGLLCGHFIAKHAPKMNSRVTQIASDALATLQSFSWPWNVRQLENIVRKAIVFAGEGEVIEPGNEAIAEIAQLTGSRQPARGSSTSTIPDDLQPSAPITSGLSYQNLSAGEILELVKQKQAVKALPDWAKIIGGPKTLELADLTIGWLHGHLPTDEEAKGYFNMSYTAWKGWVHRNRKERRETE